MIVRTCTRCGTPQQEGLVWTVWAWFRADGERVAYQQKLCLTCAAAYPAMLWTKGQEPANVCPGCGVDTSDDMDPIYLTFIPKGVGKMQVDLPTCPSCAVTIRVWGQEGATKMEDRDPSSRGQVAAPRYSGDAVLAALGVDPALITRQA